MKKIKDIDLLLSHIKKENSEWQKIIYDATGVILTENLALISNCGYVWIEHEIDYNSEDDECCEICSVAEMIDYIKAMDCYEEVLSDVSFGQFTKSELFWAIQDRVLLQPGNMNEMGEQDWAFSTINHSDKYIEIIGALVPCDETSVALEKETTATLEEALQQFVIELNRIIEPLDGFVQQKVYHSTNTVPNTYEQMMQKLTPDSPLAFLQGDRKVEIMAWVCSEKEDASIGFGTSFHSPDESLSDLGTDWIFEGLGDSFWENSYEFEEGAAKAAAMSENGDYMEALKSVFGKFRFGLSTNIPYWDPLIDVDIEEINSVMYDNLLCVWVP